MAQVVAILLKALETDPQLLTQVLSIFADLAAGFKANPTVASDIVQLFKPKS